VTPDPKPSVEAAVELLVYAPLGFALEARSLLPGFIERGRNQVTMARMIGQFAVQQGQVEAVRRLGPVQAQVEALLGDLGLVPTRSADAAPEPAPTPAARPRPRVVPDVAPEPSASTTPSGVPRPDAADLAIPDYDSLAASQVVPRLAGLTPDELAQVRAYEAGGRGRKTILNRIAQLQSS
jgi:hypothetical protein